MFDSYKILGVKLNNVSVPELHSYLQKVIEDKNRALILNLNVHCINLCQKHEWLKNFINQADMVFCDGDGVRWGTRLLGYSPPPKITYDRWIWKLSEWAEARNYSIYFLGGEPGVTAQAAKNINNYFPNLKIVGSRHGYFQKTGKENEDVILAINRAKPDILIVGFGMPIQEEWLKHNWEKIEAHIFLTGGAVFDYASGRAKRAPDWMITMNLEWFYRFLKEPKRLFIRYFYGNPYFIVKILQEKMRIIIKT